MTVLSILLLIAAIALVFIGQMLKRRQVEASWELSQKLNNLSKPSVSKDYTTAANPSEESDTDTTEPSSGEIVDDWDAQWDEAEAQIDEDFYRLLGTTAGVFKGIAIFLAAAAALVLILSRVMP